MIERLFITLQVLRGDVAARRDDEEGATAIEYGLLAALIAVAIIAAVTAVGLSLEGVFDAVDDGLNNVAPA